MSLSDLYRLANEAHAHARLAMDGIQNLGRELHIDEVKTLYHSLDDVRSTQQALFSRAVAMKLEGPKHFTPGDWELMCYAHDESPATIVQFGQTMNNLAKRYPALKLATV